MSTIIWGTHEDEIGRSIVDWYCKKANKEIDYMNTYCVMGILKDNTLQGAAIFQNYNKSNIEIHFYGPGAVSIKSWRNALWYAFDYLKVNRLTTMCERKNKQVLKALPRLGFKYETSLKRYFSLDSGSDAIVHVMFKDDAQKYLRPYNDK